MLRYLKNGETNLMDVPSYVIEQVFSSLTIRGDEIKKFLFSNSTIFFLWREDLVSCLSVCKKFNAIAKKDSLWRKFSESYCIGFLPSKNPEMSFYQHVTQVANTNRSQGLLTYFPNFFHPENPEWLPFKGDQQQIEQAIKEKLPKREEKLPKTSVLMVCENWLHGVNKISIFFDTF